MSSYLFLSFTECRFKVTYNFCIAAYPLLKIIDFQGNFIPGNTRIVDKGKNYCFLIRIVLSPLVKPASDLCLSPIPISLSKRNTALSREATLSADEQLCDVIPDYDKPGQRC